MTYLNLPNLNNSNLDFNILYKNQVKNYENTINGEQVIKGEQVSNGETINTTIICPSLYNYLIILKQVINNYSEYWDIVKKLTNPYEYIHTCVPNYKFSLCKYKPLSRAFFKMIEIVDTFSFLTEKTKIKSFHLAEGPGGFIEAFNYIRHNKEDLYYGMTLLSDDINIPSWKRASQLLNNNPNIIIEYGASKTGDLFLKENLTYCYKKYSNSMDYITGDGGFDFSNDFNNQEDISFKLILSQIFFALIMQKTGGNFILKMFDIFKYKTLEVIYLLCNMYENVYIFKPNTSRIANSEKYIICINYKNNNKKIITNIIENFDLIINNIDIISSLFSIPLNKHFLTKVQEINAIYGEQQLENISATLNLIKELKALNIKYNLMNNEYSALFKYLHVHSKLVTSNKCLINEIQNGQNSEDISKNSILIKYHNSNDLINEYFTKLNNIVIANIHKSINWCKKHQFTINKEFSCY
jgi:23S rRNA U2552 (ribose-2'-O)-methylase RlmE/FtsJ